MRFCFWFWHKIKPDLPDSEVAEFKNVPIYFEARRILFMFLGKTTCERCGKKLDVHKEGWVGPGEKLGPWQIANRNHLQIFENFKKRIRK